MWPQHHRCGSYLSVVQSVALCIKLAWFVYRSNSVGCGPDPTDAASVGHSANQNPQASPAEVWGTPFQGQGRFASLFIWTLLSDCVRVRVCVHVRVCACLHMCICMYCVHVYRCVCVCVLFCVCVYVCMQFWACVCVCVGAYMCGWVWVCLCLLSGHIILLLCLLFVHIMVEPFIRDHHDWKLLFFQKKERKKECEGLFSASGISFDFAIACLRNLSLCDGLSEKSHIVWWPVWEIPHCVMACLRNPALYGDGLFQKSCIVWWAVSEIPCLCGDGLFQKSALCDGLFKKFYIVRWWLVWEILRCMMACSRNPALYDGLFQKSCIVWWAVSEIPCLCGDGLFQKSSIVWWLVSEIPHCEVMACLRNPALYTGLFQKSINWWWLVSGFPWFCGDGLFQKSHVVWWLVPGFPWFCGDGLFQKSGIAWWLLSEIWHCVMACVRNPTLCEGLFQKSRIVWWLVWEIPHCVIACFRNPALWGSRACGWCWSAACCPTSRLAGTPARGPSAKGWSTWTRRACGWGLGWCSFATVFDVLGELACTVCIWRCEHSRFCVEVFLHAVYKFSFIHHSCWSCICQHEH